MLYPKTSREKRDRRTLFYVILLDCLQEKVVGEIQAHTMIHITHQKKLVADLIKYGLLVNNRKAHPHRHGKELYSFYKTTDKGARYVELYPQIFDSIKGFKHYA